MRRLVLALALVPLVAGHGCTHGGGGSGSSGPVQVASKAPPVALSVGTTPFVPAGSSVAGVTSADWGRLGVAQAPQLATYELTTPLNTPFSFTVVSRTESNSGPVSVSVGHLLDGGQAPTKGVESIAGAGILITGSGPTPGPSWLGFSGDGFVRATLSGKIGREQLLVVKSSAGGKDGFAVIHISIGSPSLINTVDVTSGNDPNVIETKTLYSSDSYQFGLPTISQSGDKTTIAVYEGDRAQKNTTDRYEMRLQYDRVSGQTTGGGSAETNADTGHWRDHVSASLFNVLAVVSDGDSDVTVKLSFDRGASFGQTETISNSTGGQVYGTHLVQTAMASDYTLAVAYWRSTGDYMHGTSELCLVEGKPSAFDATGSPTRFAMGTPEVLVHKEYGLGFGEGSMCPAVMGVKYSDGGDLVIGYGTTVWIPNEPREPRKVTEYRCWVRLYGRTPFDTLVDSEEIFTYSPNVSLVGSGDTMGIWYSCEGPQGMTTITGVHLYHSADGGRTFPNAEQIGNAAATLSEVFARVSAGKTRVDVVYLEQAGTGAELHIAHWDDYGTTARQDYRLTTAVMDQVNAPAQPPPGTSQAMPSGPTTRTTEVSWLGYDACLAGDELVVVYDETTNVCWYSGYYNGPARTATAAISGPATSFQAAVPPPLSPGLTAPVPAPDPAHSHQLKLVRLH